MAEYIVDRDMLVELIRHDCEAFFGQYLGEELELDVPDLHKDIWDEFLTLLDQVNDPEHLTGILKKLLAVPREHAKTTVTKLAVVLFLRYSRLSFCAYTSNTFSGALNAIRDIKEWFMSDRDQDLYGPCTSTKASESEGLFILEISTPLSRRPKKVILKAFGQGTQIRGVLISGKRPDFLIFDDIESHDTTDSPVQQKKLDAWCLGTALKSMARRGVCVFIGNMIKDTSLLARLSKMEEWNPTVLGSIIRLPDGTIGPLWPGRWTLEALLADYASYRVLGVGHLWEAEMMNLTTVEILGESLDNAIRPPRPMPEDLGAGFLCLDPAFGVNAWNDDSAITVHALQIGADIPAMIESRKGKWTSDRLFDEMLQMSSYWGIHTWVIEAQAAQVLLIPYFKALMIQRGLNPEFITMIPIYAGKNSKASRILAWRGAVAGGSYGVVEEEQEMIEKLEAYAADSTEHDDLCDSGAYGVQVWALHGEEIRGKGTVNVAGFILGNYGQQPTITSVTMGIP